MEYSYKIVQDPFEHAEIYRRLKEEDLLWCLYSEIEPEDWSEDLYIKMHNSSTMRETWAGYIDGELAGVAYIQPFCGSLRSCCAEIGLTGFRKFFKQAARLARGALLTICERHGDNIRSIVGRVPAPNHHILRMLGMLGFQIQCKIPGLFWFTRKRQIVDGFFVMAQPQDIKATWEVE